MESIPAEQKQLYHLIVSFLQPRIESSDDLGTLVGYSVIRDLINFKMPREHIKSTKARIIRKVTKELRLAELDAVYSGFIKTINEVTQKEIYNALTELASSVKSDLEELLTRYHVTRQNSVLLQNILTQLESKLYNYEEKLRIRGLLLVNHVRARGSLPSRSDFIQDYRIIEQCFLTDKKKTYFWHPGERRD